MRQWKITEGSPLDSAIRFFEALYPCAGTCFIPAYVQNEMETGFVSFLPLPFVGREWKGFRAISDPLGVNTEGRRHCP